jgi:tetratricopeptide (TPR) repeat protein
MFSAMTGHADEAQAELEASLEIAQGQADDWGVANALTGLGWLASNGGDTDRGIALQTKAIELFVRARDEFKLTYAYNSLGETLRVAGDEAGARRHFGASLEVCRRIGHTRGAAVALANLGGLELTAGRGAAAAEAFRAALAEFVEIRDPVNIATCLVGLAGTLDDPLRMARQLGYAEHLLRETGGQFQPADQRQHDDLAARCRARLGEDGFARARAEGRAMSLAQTLEPDGG